VIHEGRTEAQKYSFNSIRGEVLLVVLMFAFGHGCTSDPLYPGFQERFKMNELSILRHEPPDWRRSSHMA